METAAITEHISALEHSLLDAGSRTDAAHVAELLADDFEEFGSSGRTWDKATTVAGLAAESPNEAVKRAVTDLRVRLLSADVALVTYRVVREAPGESKIRTLRSSVWKNEQGSWRMVFHQGTRAA